MMPTSWGDWAALVAIVTFCLGGIYFMLRAKLVGDFVPRPELARMHGDNVKRLDELKGEVHESVGVLTEGQRTLRHRIANVEQVMAALPTRSDLRRLENGLSAIAERSAATDAKLEGLSEGQDRTHDLLKILVNAQLPHNGDD